MSTGYQQGATVRGSQHANGSDSINDTASDLAVAAQLPPNMMLLKMENESIMAAARIVPRDAAKIVGQLQSLIDAYPAAADEAIYSRPVGSVTRIKCASCGIAYEESSVTNDTVCPNCGKRDGRNDGSQKVTKFAEGLSIRAAESIRSIYGYTRLATTTERLPDGTVRITGTLVDYAAGNMTSDDRLVSQYYKARGGGMQKVPEDRFLNVVVKAEKSKLRRDVILDSIPSIVKAMYRDACEKKMLELVTPEVVEQQIVPAFAEYRITLADLEKIIGRPASMGWKQEERVQLRRLLTALKNEEMTREELIASISEKPAEPANDNAPTGQQASGANFTNPTGGAQAPVHPPRQPEGQASTAPQKPADELPDWLQGVLDKMAVADEAGIEALLTMWCSPGTKLPTELVDMIQDAAAKRLDALGVVWPSAEAAAEPSTTRDYEAEIAAAHTVADKKVVLGEMQADEAVAPDRLDIARHAVKLAEWGKTK